MGIQVNCESVQQLFSELRKSNTTNIFINEFAGNHQDWITQLWDTDLNQLSNNVQSAYNFYKKNVEDGDFSTVSVYKYSSAIVPIYVVGVSTDGDISSVRDIWSNRLRNRLRSI